MLSSQKLKFNLTDAFREWVWWRGKSEKRINKVDKCFLLLEFFLKFLLILFYPFILIHLFLLFTLSTSTHLLKLKTFLPLNSISKSNKQKPRSLIKHARPFQFTSQFSFDPHSCPPQSPPPSITFHWPQQPPPSPRT